MKKLVLISSLCMAGFLAGNAQSITSYSSKSFHSSPLRQINEMAQSKMDLSSSTLKSVEKSLSKKIVTFKNSSSRAATSALYSRPVGAFYLGLDFDGTDGYNPQPYIMAAAFNEVPFLNASTEQNIVWDVNGNEHTEDVDSEGNLFFEIGAGGYYMPRITAGNTSYYYGKDFHQQIAYNNCIVWGSVVATDGLWRLTNYHAWKGGVWGTDQNGAVFGTGSNQGGTTPKEIMSRYDKPLSTLYVETIDILLVGVNSNNPMPADGKLDLTIYKINEEGKLTNEMLGKSEVYTEDLEQAWRYSDGTSMYNAPFKFKEIDPETGLETEIALEINDAFAIVISGFDKAGYDIGFAFSQAPFVDNGVGGSAYFEMNGEYYSWGKFLGPGQTNFVNGYDLVIHLNGMYNLLEVDGYSKNLIAPTQGGDAYYTVEGQQYTGAVLYSSLPLDTENYATIEGIPDWIEYMADDSMYEERGYTAFRFTATALPSQITGRKAEIILRSKGAVTSFTIIQGDATDVDKITAEGIRVNRNGEYIELTYPQSVNSVAVINAAGQMIRDYILPSTGSFSLPTATLNKGLYILKFNGSQTATVKIVK